jgi:hypothetical protein
VGCAAVVAIAWRRHAAPPVERTTAELNRIKDRLMRERSAPAPASYTGDPDSVESRAQRELRRLQSQLDQTPYADPGADVRLRSGDRMSRVEYDRLRRGASEAAR